MNDYTGYTEKPQFLKSASQKEIIEYWKRFPAPKHGYTRLVEPKSGKVVATISYTSKLEMQLLHQIIGKITNSIAAHYWQHRKRMIQEFELTTEQAHQVKVRYKALRRSLAKELERCFNGFIQANNLGVGTHKGKLTKEEMAEIARILHYADGIDPTIIYLFRKRGETDY